MADKADKSVTVMVEGLTRAATAPQGVPLFGQRKAPGLFPQSATAKMAAHRCLEKGLLQVVGVETKGKTAFDLCTITAKGLRFLLGATSPRTVLDSLTHAVATQRNPSPQLTAEMQSCQQAYDALEEQMGHLLAHLHQPTATNGVATSLNGTQEANVDWRVQIAPFLRTWRIQHPQQDCPLPDLFRHLSEQFPSLSIGQFHDGVRQLTEEGQIRLYPWTGPLHELPEPAFALLVGHAVGYYAGVNE